MTTETAVKILDGNFRGVFVDEELYSLKRPNVTSDKSH